MNEILASRKRLSRREFARWFHTTVSQAKPQTSPRLGFASHVLFPLFCPCQNKKVADWRNPCGRRTLNQASQVACDLRGANLQSKFATGARCAHEVSQNLLPLPKRKHQAKWLGAFFLAGAEGLEPTTHGFGDQYSTN